MRLAAERVYDFGDLLKDVAFVFGGVFVAVGLAYDLPGAIVACFGDHTVWFFDFGPLVVGVVGVGRFVQFGIGLGFEVTVAVIGVFGFVAEWVGVTLIGRPVGVSFGGGRVFGFLRPL